MGEKKRVAIFGGSGLTGVELVSAALRHGLSVKGLYRPGSEPANPPQGLEVVKGRLTAVEDVQRTLEGTDGAILVFGPRLKRNQKPDVFCAAATSIVVAEMKRLGIERLICQTGAMAGGDTPNWSRTVRSFVRRYRKTFPEVDADRDAQERIVKDSGLDWILAKPFRISGAKGKGRVRVAENIRITAFTSTRRADLAEFLVKEFMAGEHHRKAVYVIT